MAADREKATLADYAVTALSPALIMALVGSLTIFLIEVCYAGQYTGRLMWTLFFFVFATVLISRIAIDMHKGLAAAYGLALALATFIALVKFVDTEGTGLAGWGPTINLGLMAVIWWSANKLTWDCTFIDDNVDDSGKGLLEEVGLSDGPAAAEPETVVRPKKGITGLGGWLERYDRYRAKQRKKPHTPGVWVVYFSLAALPLFGLGQALIPAGETGRRAYVFWLMIVYVGSGLGLLVTTSFLGLRRYLRQRNLQMPAAMTGLWLGIGALLIAVFLLVGAFLPRPNAEYSVLPNWMPLGSKQRDASRFALKRDGEGKGEGRASSDQSDQDKADAKDGRGGQGQSGGKQSGRSGTGEKDGDKGNTSGEGKSSGKDGKPGDQGDGKSRNDRSRSNARGKADGQSSKSAESKEKSRSGSQQRSEQRSGDQKGSDSNPEGYRPPDASALSQAVSWIAKLLKWLVLGLLILVVVAFVLWALLRYLGHFTLWANNLLAALEAWWNNLFGWGARKPVTAEAEPAPSVRRPKPFADFRNPFDDGSAAEQSPDDLVRYSFLALEAWAFERDLARRPDETPLEFADRLGRELPPLERDAQRLTVLYARLAYARRRLPESSREAIQQFWTQLELTAEQPLSA